MYILSKYHDLTFLLSSNILLPIVGPKQNPVSYSDLNLRQEEKHSNQ